MEYPWVELGVTFYRKEKYQYAFRFLLIGKSFRQKPNYSRTFLNVVYLLAHIVMRDFDQNSFQSRKNAFGQHINVVREDLP